MDPRMAQPDSYGWVSATDVLEECFPHSCNYIYCGADWHPHWGESIWKALTRIEKIAKDFPELKVQVAQIKDKFGQLRLYVDYDMSYEYLPEIVDLRSIVKEAETVCASPTN